MWKIDNHPASFCTAHPNVAVLYRTLKCPLCILERELEDLAAESLKLKDAVAALKLNVEELQAAYGEPKVD